MKQKKKHFTRHIFLAIALILAVLCVGCILYIQDYYHADSSALDLLDTSAISADAYTTDASAVQITEVSGQQITFAPEHPVAGLIFYPGGKVQYEAYAPLMHSLAKNGILCVLLHMPGNLAVLNMNAADGIADAHPEVTNWYIGGHSLGGAMAASYAAKHTDTLTGLILLAAYSTADLTESNLAVLSIYGTEDGVLKQDSYQKDFANLPADTTEMILNGGCHSYFGDYGVQKGDGTPTISREDQIAQTTAAILDLVQRHE